MKFLLTLMCTLLFAPGLLASDYSHSVYTPDENHTPPDVIQAEEERAEKTYSKEKQQDVRNPTTDPRVDKYKHIRTNDREYDYSRD